MKIINKRLSFTLVVISLHAIIFNHNPFGVHLEHQCQLEPSLSPVSGSQSDLKYVSNVALSTWRLYNVDETYELYFKASYLMNKYGDITNEDVVQIN